MLWEILIGICTLLGGLAAGIGIYEFVGKKVRIVYSGPKPSMIDPTPSLPANSSISKQDYDNFRKKLKNELNPDVGALILYTEDHQVGQKVTAYPQKYWIRNKDNSAAEKSRSSRTNQDDRLSESIVTRHRINDFHICAAIFILKPDDYIVWIGKREPTRFFRKPTSVPVFAKEVTAIALH